MTQLRVALAQVDTTVGDLTGNAALVRDWTKQAAAEGAHLVAFPEMTLTGYPAEDLVLRGSFVEAARQALERLAVDLAADGLGEIAVVVGYLDRAPNALPRLGRPAREPQNAAALLYGGRVVLRYAKHHLPNYGVFDEARYFVPGSTLPVVRLHGIDVAIVVCEDLWQEGGPIAAAAAADAGLVVCINASPYEQGKVGYRSDLAGRRAREAGAALVYVNQVGGQDELVFDGGSLAVTADGTVVARSPQFEQLLLVTDLELPLGTGTTSGSVDALDGTTMTIERHEVSTTPLAPYPPVVSPISEPADERAEVYAALVTATRDYVTKNGFRSVILGLSGGIDSALVATIAADAIGPEHVFTLGLPSRWSSDHSVDDARELAVRQGISYTVLPIEPMIAAYQGALEESGGLHGLAAENLQARVRGTTLMALSNEHGHLVLTTGNKSELATGYSTLYGDSAGGFAPIKDVFKTLVWELCRWRNAEAVRRGETPPIPENSISKPPSAELSPGQLDTDSLPSYEILDALLDDYIERDLGRDELIAAGHDQLLVERVIRMVDAAEYKRRQYPPGPKTTLKAFGRDRRLPITSRWREIAAPHVGEPDQVRPEQTS
ncbi:MAG: NAD+ synthase [Pseudonocardiales bacterium]|nr:NAD+ synthase [Pseudonocardiales bacterium]